MTRNRISKEMIDKKFVGEVDGLSQQLADTDAELSRIDSKKLDKTGSIAVSQIDKNTGKLDQTYLADELLQQIAGEAPVNAVPPDKGITREKIADKAVGASQTTFMKQKNLFNGEYVGAIVGGTTYTEYSDARSIVFEGEKGKQYTISRSDNGGDRFRVYTSVGRPVHNTVISRTISIDDNLKSVTVDLAGDEDHIVVYVKTRTGTTVPDWIQIEEGGIATDPDLENKGVPDFPKLSIPSNMLKDVDQIGWLSGSGKGLDVKMSSQKVVTVGSVGYVNCGTIRHTLKDGEWDFSHITTQTVFVAFDTRTKDIMFYSSADFATRNRNTWVIGVIRKDGETAQMNGIYSFNGSIVKPYTGGGGSSPAPEPVNARPSFLITHDTGGEFEKDPDYIAVDENTQFQAVYDVYDDLVARHPDYVSRSLLGNDGDGNPVYRYDFNAGQPYNSTYNFPKVYYQSALHGHEKQAAMAGAVFFKELCDKWKEKDSLRVLRWNVSFVVVPVANPSGFNLNQRKNANGVDLNRNFPTSWSPVSDTESIYYSGPSALSEPETQFIHDIMTNEGDILFAIDNHNSGPFTTYSTTYAYWLGTNDEDIKKLAYGLGFQASSRLQQKYPEIQQTNKTYAQISGAGNGTTTKHWESFGKPALLLETTSEFAYDLEKTQEVNSYLIGNTILGVIRNYDAIR